MAMKVGTLRRDSNDWYVVYFVSGEDVDAFARVEMRLVNEDYEKAVEGDRVHFDAVKVGDKYFAKLQELQKGARQINEHLKNVILGQ